MYNIEYDIKYQFIIYDNISYLIILWFILYIILFNYIFIYIYDYKNKKTIFKNIISYYMVPYFSLKKTISRYIDIFIT